MKNWSDLKFTIFENIFFLILFRYFLFLFFFCRQLEEKTGKRIYQLFDYMIGVSTGSIIVGLLAFKRLSVNEVTKLYEELGREVFQQTYIKAVTGIVKSQAYYDTSKYEAILKEYASEQVMAETVRHADCPKVAFVSAIMSSSR